MSPIKTIFPRCKCGYEREDHERDTLEETLPSTEDWSYQTDTVTLPTDAYGEINFMSAENDILPLVSFPTSPYGGILLHLGEIKRISFQYLRCDVETKIANLTDLLLNKWSLPFPNLLISVFGGHSKFDSSLMGEST